MGRDFEYDDEFLDSCSKETKNFGKNKGKIYTEEEINDLVAQKVLQELEKKEKEAREELEAKEARKQFRQEKIKDLKHSILNSRAKFTLKLAEFSVLLTIMVGSFLGFGHLLIGNASKEGKKLDAVKAGFKSNPAYVQSVEKDKSLLLERVAQKLITDQEFIEQVTNLESQAYAEKYVQTNYPEIYDALKKEDSKARTKMACSIFFGFMGFIISVGVNISCWLEDWDSEGILIKLVHDMQDSISEISNDKKDKKELEKANKNEM